MPHIEKKTINGRCYLYKYQCYKEDGRVRKRLIEYLGPASPRQRSARYPASFIEKKKINGRYYLYRYHSFRDENGRVKRKLLEYLGPASPKFSIKSGSKKGGKSHAKG